MEQVIQIGNKEFIKGFIAGQAILLLLIFLILRVLLFRNSDETKQELKRRLNKRIVAPKPKSLTAQQRRTLDSVILSKIDYDPTQHPFETCGWLNVLVAEALLSMRCDSVLLSRTMRVLDGLLNKDVSGILGPVSITELSLGDEYPVFRNARVRMKDPVDLRIQLDFAYDDQITLGVETQMLVNWPKPCFASLPISLGLSLVKFSGTLVVEYEVEPLISADPQSPQPHAHATYICVSIWDDFVLDFEVRSLLGHRTKVKDLPKLTSLLVNRLRAVFVEEIVWPSKKRFRIPSGDTIFGLEPLSANASARHSNDASIDGLDS